MGAARTARGSYLQSLQRSILVLDLVSTSPVGMSARELAEAANLDRTVTHRVIRTLEREELLVKRSNRFVLGPRTLLLGNRYLAQSPLRAAALPFQIDLQHRSFAGRPWRVAVLAPVGSTMTLVSETWSSTTPLDTLPGIMNRTIDQAASGRCILAYLPEGKVIDLIGEARAADLAPRFAAIRDADGVDYVSAADKPPGFAPGLSLVAAVIRRRDGQPVGGLIVSGTEMEQYTSRDSDVALQLLRAARQIGSVLG
ncbi:MAG: helix-turn-helix domain-containing protein [Trebonia sp.]